MIIDGQNLTGLGRQQLLDLIKQLRSDRDTWHAKAILLHAVAKRVFEERLTLEVIDQLREAVRAYEET
jgi:hypothetical protein